MSTIYQFIKNRKGNLVGCVLAVDKDQIGWSMCNKRDRFSKDRAIKIAIGRAVNTPINKDNLYYGILHTVPHILREHVEYFVNDRCVRYYK